MMSSLCQWPIGNGKSAALDETGGTPQVLIKHQLFERHFELVAIQSKEEADRLIYALKQAKQYLP